MLHRQREDVGVGFDVIYIVVTHYRYSKGEVVRAQPRTIVSRRFRDVVKLTALAATSLNQ